MIQVSMLAPDYAIRKNKRGVCVRVSVSGGKVNSQSQLGSTCSRIRNTEP